MSRNQPKPKGGSSGILDVLTRHVGKISALLVAIAGALTAWQQLREFIPAPSKNPACFRAELVLPREGIAVGEWSRKRFLLSGRNECRDNLQVRVEFRAASDRVRLEPPYENEWLVTSVDPGDVKLSIAPPLLRPLKLPFGNPVMIGINWRVYNVDTEELVRSGGGEIQLLDDPVSPADTASRSPR